ncbi:MAG: DUF4326 domain-containing protein [Pseudonocardiaceae bacterium]
MRLVAGQAGLDGGDADWVDQQPESGELTGRAWGCWCAPKACHADVLAVRAARETLVEARDPLAVQLSRPAQ